VTDIETRVVEQTLRIAARPETVWQYWTDPQLMADWWGAARLDPQPGGTYLVEMEGGPVMRGEFLELVPYERIVFSFGWDPTEGAPPIAPGSTRVEVSLVAHEGDTILTLRHTLPAAAADHHRAGWELYLPRLTAAVEGSRR
jgi:uncharacterized protein YndB with AHSA1/START domain